MKNLTNEELLSISIDKCCYPEIYDELSSRLARVSELEAHLRQETARLNHADKRIEELKERIDFERNKRRPEVWKEGARAMQKLEKIAKLPFRHDVAEILEEL